MRRLFLVQMPNRPHELDHLARALRARGVNLVYVVQGAIGELTCTRFITDCCDEDTEAVLRSMGYSFVTSEEPVLERALADREALRLIIGQAASDQPLSQGALQ